MEATFRLELLAKITSRKQRANTLVFHVQRSLNAAPGRRHAKITFVLKNEAKKKECIDLFARRYDSLIKSRMEIVRGRLDDSADA